MSTVRKISWFWAWQDVNEEEWLDEMSAQGLHLQRVNFPCFYYFEEGEPSTYVTGWTLSLPRGEIWTNICRFLRMRVGSMWDSSSTAGSISVKLLSLGEKAEIYSDVESKIAKYNRLIMFLVPFVPLLIFSIDYCLGD